MPQNHTPLFQATLQANDKDTLKILLHLINLSAPLTRETLFDIRHACIIRDDNFLYQKLRRMVKYDDGWLSDVEKTYIMNVRDEIEVTAQRQDSGPPEFIASFKIPAFQTRLRGLGEVVLDFIAQGRMWRLRFSIATVDHPPSLRFPSLHRQKPLVGPNTLQVALSLMEHSDSTPLEGVLKISSVSSFSPEIYREISTKSQSQLVSPPTHKQNQKKHTQSEIKATLDSVASGSVYIAEDGSLSGTLDASLRMVMSKTNMNLLRYTNFPRLIFT